MKSLKMIALFGMAFCLLACSQQKSSDKPQSRSSASSSQASSTSQPSSKQSSTSQNSISSESESPSQSSENGKQETQPSSKEAALYSFKILKELSVDPSSIQITSILFKL